MSILRSRNSLNSICCVSAWEAQLFLLGQNTNQSQNWRILPIPASPERESVDICIQKRRSRIIDVHFFNNTNINIFMNHHIFQQWRVTRICGRILFIFHLENKFDSRKWSLIEKPFLSLNGDCDEEYLQC